MAQRGGWGETPPPFKKKSGSRGVSWGWGGLIPLMAGGGLMGTPLALFYTYTGT